MQINYNVSGPKRKALVNAISQELNAPVKYLGAPTFAYEVADYNVNKNRVLSGPGLIRNSSEKIYRTSRLQSNFRRI